MSFSSSFVPHFPELSCFNFGCLGASFTIFFISDVSQALAVSFSSLLRFQAQWFDIELILIFKSGLL